MVICISCVINNCPGWIQILALIGFFAIYGLIGYLAYLIAFEKLGIDNEGSKMIGILFPLAILFGLIWIIWKIIELPFIAATKEDIKRLESLIESTGLANPSISSRKTGEFKEGDLVTGVKGNPDDYQHLDEGCACRVISVDEKGIMKLSLISHKNRKKHEDVLGNIFTAPSRNFLLKTATRRTARKSTTTKRRKRYLNLLMGLFFLFFIFSLFFYKNI